MTIEKSKELRSRLVEVERELARLKKERRAFEKRAARDIPEDLPEPRRQAPERAAERAPSNPVEPPAAAETAPAEMPDWPEAERDGTRRERFANYFMSGGLGGSVPQLRRERRAMRNKAILMAVAAVILLIAVARFLVK